MKESVLTARQLVRTYGKGKTAVHALRGADLEVARGTFVALRGRSGSGKTTLLNLVGGLDRPDGGTVTLEGQDLAQLSDTQLTHLRRHRLGFVFQTFSLLPVFSAYENVELALRLAGARGRQRDRRVFELLEMVGLAEKARHRPFELSGGEQQRAGIARALANSPAIILADEPTGDLDSATGLGIIRLFRDVVETQGVTVLVATHDPAVTENAHLTYEMVDGRVYTLERPAEGNP